LIAPQSAEAWVETARLHLALDRPGPAREAADRAVAIDRDSVEAVSMLALLDLREKRGEQALQRARELAGRRPADARAALLEGDVLAALAQPREAAEAYARAISLRADLQVAAKQSAALRAAGLPNPEAPLIRWVTEHPQDPQGRAMLGEAYLLAGRHLQAIEQYERLAANPAAGYAVLNNLAWLYQQTDDDRAEATARRAYDLASDDPSVIDTYGWILVQNGKLTEGLAALERAATLAPDNPDIRYHHAYALAQAGQGLKARAILDEVLATHPQFASRTEAVKLQQELAGNVTAGAN
jgi:tetratricopeptide (TPR) repeat protein